MRMNVVSAREPSVAAASSCSVPISRSTGTTSRTTNGSDTNVVASRIPGYAKRMRCPCAVSHDRERAEDAEERVERDGDDRDLERQPQRVHGVRIRDGRPERTEARLERAVEDERDGRDQDQREV